MAMAINYFLLQRLLGTVCTWTPGLTGKFDMDKHFEYCLVPVGSAAVVKIGGWGKGPGTDVVVVRVDVVGGVVGVNMVDGVLYNGVTGVVLPQGWRPDWQQVVRLSLDLASAVAAVHAAGILHRDIKASNVMLGVVNLPQTCLLLAFRVALDGA
jgi:hypothetical protein